MNAVITPHKFTGTVKIPASKSHTIRQLLISSLADGESEIKRPLDSLDTRSCIEACKAFGAEIEEIYNDNNELVSLKIIGNNNFKMSVVSNQIDVGNSGTTLYLALAVAALQSQSIEFTGDESIQKRSAASLLEALAGLDIQVQSNNGCAPITIKGGWKGGKVSLPCPTSQYLSALLIAAPLAPADTVTEIEVPLLNEKPYIDMTLSYLNSNNIPFESSSDYSYFKIPGGASWKSFSSAVPADFSSAAFPAAAAAITGGPVILLGLDPNDTQGDKYFFEILKKMGCNVLWQKDKNNEHTVTVSRNGVLCGGTFDLNKTPDLLPAAAVVAAYAHGDTAFINVAHARIKETDRIAVMVKELAKLGVSCTELPDGLIIHGKGFLSALEKTVIEGHGDHRIVMAFAVAALGANFPIEITTAECADVTYPGFLNLLV
ncbi:MAG: 3-phosphoshikimate 1-carboxyvinyltransferase [Treponema sp.]|jgi:3-phosphoshikimate 1-carboxyvinyltransferase|nr:3-phosphoshikimate 1-carboxyvinyltransferase [Treponema sp.]